MFFQFLETLMKFYGPNYTEGTIVGHKVIDVQFLLVHWDAILESQDNNQ